MLPDDPGPGANPTPPTPSSYPPPLDLTVHQEGTPFLAKFGPGFEWMKQQDGVTRLVVVWALPGAPVFHRVLDPEESARLLEWMLKSVTASKD